MGQRLDLQTILQNLIDARPDGKQNVYFQPPSTVKMAYPCIVYNRNNTSTRKANNGLYGYFWGYTIMVIDPNPDSDIPAKVLALPLCSFDRHYTADNLNHDLFNIYY